MHIAFGPVPSRRLGKSLGVNNIPPKHCTYSCVYCQVGRTRCILTNRRSFYAPSEILEATADRLFELPEPDSVDYITLVPDGEPTIDIYLDETLPLLKSLGYQVALLTNSSLLWREDVRYDLQEVDWISVKIDTVQETTWHKINRPHGQLNFDKIVDGIKKFRDQFQGVFVTETMLVNGLNDTVTELRNLRDFITELFPDIAYLAVPTRPPAESWVKIPDADNLVLGYQLFKEQLPKVEYLTGLEGTTFAPSGDIVRDLLSITAVHPMHESAVKVLLQREESDWTEVQQLLNSGLIRKVRYHNQNFYVRNFKM